MKVQISKHKPNNYTEYYEVKYRENGTDLWSVADLHTYLADAIAQKKFILSQSK